jgi:hypothetical protein
MSAMAMLRQSTCRPPVSLRNDTIRNGAGDQPRAAVKSGPRLFTEQPPQSCTPYRTPSLHLACK